MARRILATILFLAAPAAFADVVVKSDGKVIGLPTEIDEGGDKVKVTAENFRRWLDQSKGEIAVDGYSGIKFHRPGGKEELIPSTEIADYDFAARPDTLEEGMNLMSGGNLAQAVAAFRDVLADAHARDVFKTEAEFQIGMCFLRANNVRNAAEHFGRWKATPSRYTPQVYSILAGIHRNDRKYDEARRWHAEIEKLPGVPPSWLYASKLGLVDVDIAERKFAEAEASIRTIVSQMGADPTLASVRAHAQVLFGKLIIESGAKERLEQARKALEGAVALGNVPDPTAAAAYNALGDVIYAMGDPDGARFPYMRVVCMYPDEGQQVAHALNNAGRCFVDLWGRAERNDPEGSKHLLKEGGDLLRQCQQYRGSAAAKEALQTFSKIKERYEALGK